MEGTKDSVHPEITRILLIDDDEDDFVNIRGILGEIKKSRYKLDWKDSYAGGLDALCASEYDACLLDFRLGEHTGLELLYEARNKGIHCPFILLTGFGDFDLDIKAMQSGAADYLVKGQITAPLLERSIRYSIKRTWDMRELAEERENFKTLLNSTFEGILVHRNGRIVDANTAAGNIFGYNSEAMVGSNIFDYFRTGGKDVLEKLLDSGHEVQFESYGMKKDGSEFDIGVSTRKIEIRGQSLGLIAVHDLTGQKQLEAQILQQARLASLGLLASSLAHEIGTPLGVIRGRAELIGKSADPKVKNAMELITGQIDRVSKLVHSLLHIARGKQTEFVADVDLSAVIRDVLNLMSHELEQKNIEPRISKLEGVIVRSEPGPLGQVFLNLLVNSVHAIEEASNLGRKDSHFISISAESDDKEVTITFQDSGAGISEENLRHLFKPFFTTKDIGVGTGLGLATSYKLVQSWGGSISVESEQGSGTTFRIILKIGRQPQS